MAGLEAGNFDTPDEVRSPDKTRADVVRMGEGTTAARLTMQPGWRWSECIKPVAGTESCHVHHVGFIQSGRLHVAHDDGKESDLEPGKAYVIRPGHDAWVVGDEEVVAFTFKIAAAERSARGRRDASSARSLRIGA